MKIDKEFDLLDSLFDELFPIMRSISGEGIEKSIGILAKQMPLEITKTPSNSKVFDWVVPQEWHFKSATLIGPDGEVVCDANINNLHVLNYSEPIDQKLSLEELLPHLFSIPELPNAIPYVTSYYKRKWGFCLTHEQKQNLKPGLYHAKIDTAFVDGGVPFAQCKLEGETDKEILISSYLCHPSMANNELSGPLVLLALYNRIKNWRKRRFTYRFLINPETIGSLCFLHHHGKEMKENLVSGLVLTCLGGPTKVLNYKSSRMGEGLIDKVISYQGKKTCLDINKLPFTPVRGSDERQFCSPGFNLPVGQISRTTYSTYNGYHNSLDDKAFMGIDTLIESTTTIEEILKYMEVCGNPVNLLPFGEPQLGKRGLYPNLNAEETRDKSADGIVDGRVELEKRMILLNMADGENSLIDISKTCGCTVDELIPTLQVLESNNLISYHKKLATI